MHDKSRMLIRRDGEKVYFKPLHWRIFVFLRNNKDEPVSVDDIYNDIYSKVQNPPKDHTFAQYILRIRKYLDGTNWYLETRSGRGFESKSRRGFCYYTLRNTGDGATNDKGRKDTNRRPEDRS